MLRSSILRAGFAAIGSVCLIGSATAAELTGAEIKELVSGKSVYMEFTEASTGGVGQGVIFYAADGTALYRRANGGVWHGTWSVKDNTTCTDWKQSPNNPCSKYDKQGDTITQINVPTGKPRGKVLKTAAGNAEKIVAQ